VEYGLVLDLGPVRTRASLGLSMGWLANVYELLIHIYDFVHAIRPGQTAKCRNASTALTGQGDKREDRRWVLCTYKYLWRRGEMHVLSRRVDHPPRH